MRNAISIRIAVEDALSEAVLRHAIASRPVRYEIGAVYSRGGFGYLKKQAGAFNNAAKACPFVMLTDLDQNECPPTLVASWLSGRPKHDSFLFRVAVREVESWLLGDMARLASFLHLRNGPAILAPEVLSDPKLKLLELSLRSRSRQIRDALVWRDDSTGRLYQGPDYNATLTCFVTEHWDISTARLACPSLERLFAALGRLESKFA